MEMRRDELKGKKKFILQRKKDRDAFNLKKRKEQTDYLEYQEETLNQLYRVEKLKALRAMEDD